MFNKKFFEILALFLFLHQGLLAKGSFNLGYRLDYATSSLKASEIDSAFSDFNNGHSSSFFFRSFLTDRIFLEIGPGAWNSENTESQFTYQYNTIGLGYQIGEKFFFEIGFGVGAGLMAITTGDQKIGEIQKTGTILRDEVGIGQGHFGLGYKFNSWTLLLDARQTSFFHEKFSKLNGAAVGFATLFNL